MKIKGIRMLSVILAVIMLFGNFTALAAEREVVASGTSGTVTWCFYSDGELVISGKGRTNTPWKESVSAADVTKVTVKEGITEIAHSAFLSYNALTDVTIPSSVNQIWTNAFSECESLENVYFEGGVSDWISITFTNLYSNPLYYAPNLYIDGVLLTELIIPDGVTSVCNNAFCCYTTLSAVALPEGLESIGSGAFSGCTGLQEISIPDTVTEIGSDAFKNCSALTEISIPQGVSVIESKVFSGCVGLTKVALPETVTDIGADSFLNCVKLTDISLPEGVTSIGKSAFYNCRGLTELTLPESVTDIGESAFGCCHGLTEIKIPDDVTSISAGMFKYCSRLKDITISESVTSIGSNAFYYCDSLEKISIPDSVTAIGVYAFYCCSSLKEISIPNGVTIIGASAFSNCENLATIKLSENLEYIGRFAFYKTAYYEDVANWDNGFLYIGTNLIAIDNKIVNKDCKLYSKTTLIASYTFEQSEIVTLDMSDNLKHINDSAFAYCMSLQEINLSDGLLSIGSNAFYHASELKKIEIPEGVSELPSSVFDGASALEEVTLNNGLKTIQAKAFGCNLNLKALEIPGTVTSINSTAFRDSGITDIYYGDNKAQWKRATNGESFDGITVHYTLKSDDESVIIQHTDKNFPWEAGNVHLKVEDLTNVTTSYEQNGFYNRLLINPIQVLDIKLVDGDDKPIQPLSDEKITVKIKASDEFKAMLKTALSSVSEYDISADKIDFVNDSFVFDVGGQTVTVPAAEKFLKSFKVIHWKSDAVLPTDHESFTHDMLSVKNGYIVLQTNHFSEYAVCTDMLEIEQAELEIENGKTAQLNVTVGEGETVTYTSSDENVATVDSNGVVTAVGPGTATITATVNGTGVSAKCTVNVPFRAFTVKWVVDGVVTEQEITEQSPLTAPAEAPEKAGYIFKGWSPAIPDTMPAENLTFTAVFEAAPVAEIEIITAPTKTAYTYKSGNIDLSGIELKVTYEDGYSETVTDTSKMTVSGFDSKKVGNQTVTVEYAGVTDEFQVGVSYAWWQWIIRIILLGIFWY